MALDLRYGLFAFGAVLVLLLGSIVVTQLLEDDPKGEDIVVGVSALCDLRVIDRGSSTTRETRGDQCLTSTRASNVRQEVTVRTPKGETYTVEAPPGRLISLGDRWP